MSDRKTTLIWSLRDEVSASAKKLQNNLDQVGVKSKGATGALGKLSVATGGLVTPTSMAAAGALAFVGVINNATQAAIAEEKNIAHLSQALKANIPMWHGNTAAIEKTIAAREELAFADDELRDSLALLVGATKDVNKAFAIQRTAMDLARFKGISLQEASEALVKVEAGQYRALKSLGIVLKEGATAQEALTAVQKVANGQAETYAQTIEGKLTVAQIKFNDAQEDFGTRIMPLVATGMERLAELAGGDILGTASEDAERYAKFMAKVNHEVYLAPDLLYDASRAFGDARENASDFATKGLRPATRDAEKLKKELRLLKSQAQTALGPVLEAIYGPAILKGEEAGLLGQIRDTKEELKEAKKAGDKLEITRLQGQLASERADLVLTREKLSALGDKPAKDNMSAWLLAVNGKVDNLNYDTKALLTTFRVLAGYTGGSGGGGGGSSTNKPLASGGPVNLGTTLVGEHGPEYLITSGAGNARVSHSTPAGRGNMGSNAGGGFTIQGVSEQQIVDMVDRGLFFKLQRAAPTSLRT